MNAAVHPLPQPHAARRLRCLWISRDIPFPQDAGDRIYSANLAAALARANVDVRYLGYLQTEAQAVPGNWVTEWVAVNGAKRNAHSALLSRYPRIAAVHATRSYRELLQQQLDEYWDAIVLDGYGSGWALQACLQARAQCTTRRPLLIYVSHNHEESLWRDMTRATDRLSVKRLAVWQNYRKARALERALVGHAELVTTISAEDAQAYAEQQHSNPHRSTTIVLTPGYAGPTRVKRGISTETPRRVVMMGSYRWLIKQENLRRLVALADPVFAANNIVLDIIGDVPEELLRELLPQVRATRFHGFVTDVLPFFDQARLALVPEVVGGGFKLKFLDYIFGRVPVVTIAAATAGIPPTLAECMLPCDDLNSLVNTVVQSIDNINTLNLLQDQAYQRAAPLFRWDDRGHTLATTIRRVGRLA